MTYWRRCSMICVCLLDKLVNCDWGAMWGQDLEETRNHVLDGSPIFPEEGSVVGSDVDSLSTSIIIATYYYLSISDAKHHKEALSHMYQTLVQLSIKIFTHMNQYS